MVLGWRVSDYQLQQLGWGDVQVDEQRNGRVGSQHAQRGRATWRNPREDQNDHQSRGEDDVADKDQNGMRRLRGEARALFVVMAHRTTTQQKDGARGGEDEGYEADGGDGVV